MKKLFVTFCFLSAFLSLYCHANSALPEVNFEYVGPVGFAGDSNKTRMAVDGNGDAYVIYVSDDNFVNVKFFNKSSQAWEDKGPQNTLPYYHRYDATVSLSGEVYVAVAQQGSIGLKLYKMQDNTWLDLGFIPNSKDLPSVVVDTNGTPFISYQNASYVAEVSFYNGSEFVVAGTTSLGNKGLTKLIRAPGGDLFLAVGTYAGRVLRWRGTEWMTLDLDVAPGNTMSKIDLAVDVNNIPYFAYLNNNGEMGVAKLVQDNFELISPPPQSSGTVYTLSMTVDGGGTIFLAEDSANYTKLNYFREGTWTQSFETSQHANTPSLSFSPHGEVYVAYSFHTAGATVEKTVAANGGAAIVDPTTGQYISETDPIYTADKQSLLRKEETQQWDKNAADDFDGQYVSLIGAPVFLSDLVNDLNIQNGVSPTLSLEENGDLTITDINGTSTTNIKGSDGISPTVAVDGSTLTITNADGSSSAVDIGEIVSEQIASQNIASNDIWAVISENGSYLVGEGIRANSVTRLERGVYSMCVEDTSLLAPLGVTLTINSEAEHWGSAMTMSTTQINQPRGCFKVFGKGVTDNKHWDTSFTVRVSGSR